MPDTPTTPAPALGDLLRDAPTNWGKWGPDDEVGALNYLGPEQVLAAVRLVSQGKVFTLQRLIGDPKGDPVWPGRTPAERTQILDESDWDEGGKGPAYPGGLHYADDKDRRLPAGLHAVRRPGPPLVRRQDLERL